MNEEPATPSLVDRLAPSDSVWRTSMLVYALVGASLWAWNVTHLDRTSGPGIAATTGFDFGPADHDRLRPIRGIDADSGLAATGARVGDRVKFDEATDKYRSMIVGESIGLTLHPAGRDESPRHLEIQAIADKDVVAHPLTTRLIDVAANFSYLLWLVTGALLAWRLPQRGPVRVMSFIFLTAACIGADALPPGSVLEAFLWLQPAVIFAIYVGFPCFCLVYPSERPHWDRRWIRIAFWSLTTCAGLTMLVWSPASRIADVPGRFGVLDLATLTQLFRMGSALTAFAALGRSWWMTRGAVRQRVAWIAGCMGLVYSGNLASFFALIGVDFDPLWAGVLWNVAQALGSAGLVYALLRNRLFDVGFALNRLSVYGLVGLVAIAIAVVLQRLGNALLHPNADVGHAVIDVLIGLALLASFPFVRLAAERIVQTVLYPRWRATEEALAGAIANAASIQGREALFAHYLGALKAYTGGASIAVYNCVDRACVRIAGDLRDAPASFTACLDDDRRLQASRLPRRLQSATGDHALVAPVMHRGQLTGFLLVGGKPDQHRYRPDERRTIGNVAVQLNDDIQADAQRVNRQLLEEKMAAEGRARAAAESANEAKSAFLATMSHEIRTPMNGVIGMSGVLLESPLNDDQREVATTIRDSGEALMTIIDDILDFSKIEAGKMEVESHPFELRPCIESALGLIRPRTFEKNVELIARIDDDVPIAVSSDSTRLRQILLNLLSNAVKFTAQGNVTLTVAKGEGDVLAFAVRDSGIGLSAEGIGKLFQRFGQAESSTTRQYGGTGLGLVISKKLTELMGGTMTVESGGPGQGSTFRFDIRAPRMTLAPRAAATRTIVDPSMAARHPLCILLAEDNVVNQKLAMRLLKQMGYEADLAVDGLEAIQHLERARCDVVLMDVQMPGMDGLEASRRIVERWPVDRPRIVAMTANAMQGDREACLAAGMDDYVTKPIRVDALVDALLRVSANKATA